VKSEERRQLGAAIEDLRTWVGLAEQIQYMGAHMPLTGPLRPSPVEEQIVTPLLQLSHSGDLATAAALSQRVFFDKRDRYKPAREAAARLLPFHHSLISSGNSIRLSELHSVYASRTGTERETISHVLSHLDQLSHQAGQMMQDAAHMPITGSGLLTDSVMAGARSIIDTVREHGPAARALLDPGLCLTEQCAEGHRSASLLQMFLNRVSADGVPDEVCSSAFRVAEQLAAEQRVLASFAPQVEGWLSRAQALRDLRQQAYSAAQIRAAELVQVAVRVKIAGASMRVVALREDDLTLVESLQCCAMVVTSADERLLVGTAELAGSLIEAVRKGYTSAWNCHGDDRCSDAHRIIPDIYAQRHSIEQQLAAVGHSSAKATGELGMLADPALSLIQHLPGSFRCPEVIPGTLTNRAEDHLSAVVNANQVTKTAAARAREAADQVRAAEMNGAMRRLDLEALKKASPAPIRVRILEEHGFRNVYDVLHYTSQHPLSELDGLGESSARAIEQALLRLHAAVREDTPVRIDTKARHKRTAKLLQSLHTWDAVRRFEPTDDELALAKGVKQALTRRGPASALLTFANGSKGPTPPATAALFAGALERAAPELNDTDIWTDFLTHPAEYSAMLNELGFITEDEAKMHGDLPSEIVEAVRAKELRQEVLTASLRAYQSFGARFALVQEKVIIGDEMGLGKTIEALAVLAHLWEVGHSHFVVVCPAAVVSNWIREIHKHTALRATRWHGPDWERNRMVKSWRRSGGVAVTTYDLLSWAQNHLQDLDIGCAIFDEAHYIKNPRAQRSQAAVRLMAPIRYVVLMTGTPLENNVQEFRNLISYIRSDLAASAPEYLPSRFRRHVAPAYLRRNQEDVLTELPELVEVDEWLRFSHDDESRYMAAVEQGNFMLMRRTAMLSPQSVKMERLLEVVAEARANGRRVMVFSYFRDVLSQVAARLIGQVFGPLTGSVPASERQTLIDRFSEAEHGAVLLAQIAVGGVGLNIQSASVVVICEPQLKPTMESQAIARAHRMGQANTVQVHRLLTEDSVDARILDILASKRALFNDFARDSVIAKEAPDAVDVSDAELARMVVAAERERWLGSAWAAGAS